MANSKRKCNGCGEYFRPDRTFPGPVAWCGEDCALIVSRKRLPAVKAKAARQERAQTKEARERKREFNRSDVKWQHKQCRTAFNRMRVLQELEWFADRGMEPTCISCGKPLGGDVWSCGHMKTVGAQSSLRYDPMNTYLQHNVRCNRGLSGDIDGTKTTRGYKKGLAERFGTERAAEIIAYCESMTAPAKWEWQELEAMRKEWNAEIRRLCAKTDKNAIQY